MSTVTPGSSGANQVPSGDLENQNNINQNPPVEGGGDDPKGTVAYETHRKLLAEKKKRDEQLAERERELAEYRKREKERQEAELKAKEDWKTMVGVRDQEIQNLQSQISERDRLIAEALKRKAFNDHLGGRVDEVYKPLIDQALERIVLDPESGMPDQKSVQEVTKEFQTKYSRVVDRGNGARVPNEAPNPGGLTHAEWKKLPLADMKRRQHEVID